MRRYFDSFAAFWFPRADRKGTLEHRLQRLRSDHLEARILLAQLDAEIKEVEVELRAFDFKEEVESDSLQYGPNGEVYPRTLEGLSVRIFTPFQGVDKQRFDRG